MNTDRTELLGRENDSVAPEPLMESGGVGSLYMEHGPFLRRVAIRKFDVPPVDAEELVNDVFINYLTRWEHVRSDVRAYLVAGICNASRNYWRSKRSEGRVFADRDLSSVPAEDPSLDGLALNLVMASTLARLRERCREALRRYYFDGQDSADIAIAMQTSRSNVNYLMHVCRKRARAIYETITRVD